MTSLVSCRSLVVSSFILKCSPLLSFQTLPFPAFVFPACVIVGPALISFTCPPLSSLVYLVPSLSTSLSLYPVSSIPTTLLMLNVTGGLFFFVCFKSLLSFPGLCFYLLLVWFCLPELYLISCVLNHFWQAKPIFLIMQLSPFASCFKNKLALILFPHTVPHHWDNWTLH